jgi:hypothetical protein
MASPTPLTPNKYWNSSSDSRKDKLRAAMQVYNSIRLDVQPLKLTHQELMATDTLASNCYAIDPAILDAFVPSIRALTTAPVDPYVMDEFEKLFPSYTRDQIVGAMHKVLEDYIDGLDRDYHQGMMGSDIRSAFDSDWHVWFGMEPDSHVQMKLEEMFD